ARLGAPGSPPGRLRIAPRRRGGRFPRRRLSRHSTPGPPSSCGRRPPSVVVALPRRPARRGAVGILGAAHTIMNVSSRPWSGGDFPRLISSVPGAHALAGRKTKFHFHFFSLTRTGVFRRTP